MIKGYREKIEGELAKICEDILDVLDKHLIPSAASGESKVHGKPGLSYRVRRLPRVVENRNRVSRDGCSKSTENPLL
jgi:hypothetical protein